METNPQGTRVHYYHADANALGGVIESPIQQTIPIQAPITLPVVGGYGVARSERFSVEGILSFDSAYTQVAGSVSKKTGGWTTLASAVVENVNVLDVFRVKRIVAQVATEHPPVGYYPEVTFLGTQFEGIQIGGNDLRAHLDLNMCEPADASDSGTGHRFPKTACVGDKKFLGKVGEQYRKIANDAAAPQWVRDQFGVAPAAGDGKGHVVCSIVTSVTGEFPGKSYGHILAVPGFGKIFLGELIVNCESFSLNMVRLELGCPVQAKISMGRAVDNGSTAP
jgi:hypothetical protein